MHHGPSGGTKQLTSAASYSSKKRSCCNLYNLKFGTNTLAKKCENILAHKNSYFCSLLLISSVLIFFLAVSNGSLCSFISPSLVYPPVLPNLVGFAPLG